MKAERLNHIEEIYHAVLKIPPENRDEFLIEQCGNDVDLRGEIESLLSFEKNSGGFLNSLPESLVAEMFDGEEIQNELIGSRIGHYKIINLLGKGGMGEVYLAEDSKLERKVALKFFPPEFLENKKRMERFIREAKSASALNHPNIIVIHEINEIEGKHFIASEYIDGKTLNEYAKSNLLNLDSALDIAIQIASALDEAHTAGIVHRDIKPENVMVRSNGLVKILDFGIAKLTRHEDMEAQGHGEENTTQPAASTSPGLILGTANYMSPEQAKGAEVDQRTDIFSFGVVLYELITGKLPFEGETPLEIITSILHKEPNPLENQDIPKEIEKIIFKCLKKNRDERFQTIKEILFELKNTGQNLSAETQINQTLSPQKTEITSQNNKTPTDEKIGQKTNELVSGKLKSGRFLAFAIVLILIAAFGGFFVYQRLNAAKKIESVAVMPFVNNSGSEDAEYLSDGMTETLISSLSTIPNLSIKARSTVFTYKGKEISTKKIGEELNVDAVLLGRLVQRGNDLKLNLELVDTTTQDILWSEIYERKINDLVSLQSEIATDVSNKLRVKLTNAEQNQVAKTFTTNSEAQQLYLRGRFYWNKRTVKDFEKAVEYFKQAIEIDSNHAKAYAGLADTYALFPLYGNFRPKEFMPKAKKSALKALEIDGNLAEAHASLGRILISYDYDWKGAESEYKKSIEINPNYATVHLWYAELLAFKQKPEESLEEINKALEIDPFSLSINRMKGNILVFAGKYDEGISQLKKTEELYPENALIKYNLGDAFAAKGLLKEAVEEYLLALKFDGNETATLQNLQTGFKNGGWQGFWQIYLEDLLEISKYLLEKDEASYINNEDIAFAFAALKNKEKALEFLNKAYDERDPDLIAVKKSNVYDFLAGEPEFKELIKKVGLPE